MPAPTRPQPYRVEPNALSVPKGLVGVYTDAEIDALLAALPAGGDPAITVHAGSPPVPLSGDPTPQELEDSFAVLPNGLHYYPDNGSLVAVLRGEYQTTITITGAVKSVAQIVKSSAGLPTPENPSMIVTQAADGRWLRVRGDRLDQPFGDPEIVDIFKLVASGDLTVLNAYYTALEVDALLAALPTGGDCDTSNYYVKEDVNVFLADKADKEDTYTKPEIDAILVPLQSSSDNAADAIRELAAKCIELKKTTYTKNETDEAIAAAVSGQLTPEQIEEIISQVGPVDLTAYFKSEDFTGPNVALALQGQTIQADGLTTTNFILSDHAIGASGGRIVTQELGGPENTVAYLSDIVAPDLTAYAKAQSSSQNLLTKTITAVGYGFGSTVTPPAALSYTDTGEGFGTRLVLTVGLVNDYVALRSDFEPIKARMDAMESKGAPTVDLSTTASKESVDLLRSQVQTIFDSIYTRVEADARYPEQAKTYTKAECDGKFLTIVDINQFAYKADVYTQKQTDDRFMRIEQAFSKVDFDNQMALMLYSRKQIDDRLAAINPLGSPSINNPALAEFKQSVLDEVKLMLAGGTKQPPPDIDWTWMIRMDGAKESVSTEIQARMIGGFIELKGTLSFNAGSGAWVPLRLPPQFPLAELEANYPLAMRLVGSAVTYGYCTVSNKDRNISCSPGARSSEAAFSGIRWKAAY